MKTSRLAEILLSMTVGLAAALTHAADNHPVCQGVMTEHEIKPALSASEKLMICGNPALKTTPYQSWSDIPPAQAQLGLSAFLQDRGYLHPKFSYQESRIIISPGAITHATSILAKGTPFALDVSQKKNLLGKPLTPDVLDELEQWTTEQLRRRGYPCPEVTARADADSGNIVLLVSGGPRQDFQNMQVESVSAIDHEVLRRFDPFKHNWSFDSNLLKLSATRALDAGTVEQTSFAPICDQPGHPIRQVVVPGPPRLLTLGFSLNTEEIGRAQFSFRQTRIGKNDSPAEFTALASSKQQLLSLYYQWYYLSPPRRPWLRPQAMFTHQNENPFEITQEQLRLEDGITVDSGAGFSVTYRLGPLFSWYQGQRGIGASSARSLSLSTAIDLLSHSWELYPRRRQPGFRAGVEATWNDQAILSTFTATSISINAEKAWGFGALDPSPLLLGLRIGGAITISRRDAESVSGVPQSFFRYLGGISDLRGFGRLEIPASRDGGLTSLYSSLELRTTTLSDKFEPLVFLDVGALGPYSLSLQSPYYWSPGVGMEWQSPIGPFRGSLAHGYIADDRNAERVALSHWQVYLSLGEVF